VTGKIVGAAKFKAECLRLIDQMGHDRQPLTITKRGRPVAVLTPFTEPKRSLIGLLEGEVRNYIEPFEPAAEPADWTATA
jgi:prevent-host-death family protein